MEGFKDHGKARVLLDRVRQLLEERRALLLVHNYQPPEIQELADMCGDSLELSIKAARSDAQVLVFCGVHFMAETASILCPEKTVLLPRHDAGCPMADMITVPALEKRLRELPPMPVVTYVNSPASVKALSTICCTSANAVKVVNSLDAPELLMTPDRNLGRYAASHTDKKVHLWEGYCPIHDRLTPQEVLEVKREHQDAVFMAHPECRPEVLALADVVRSTSGMLAYPGETRKTSFIVGTEVGLLHPLRKAHPHKSFYPASGDMLCVDMKRIGLEDLVRCLEKMEGEVRVPEAVRRPAMQAVQRMVELA